MLSLQAAWLHGGKRMVSKWETYPGVCCSSYVIWVTTQEAGGVCSVPRVGGLMTKLNHDNRCYEWVISHLQMPLFPVSPQQRRIEASAWACPGVRMLWQIPAGPPGGSGGAFSRGRARGSASRYRHQGMLRVYFYQCRWWRCGKSVPSVKRIYSL